MSKHNAQHQLKIDRVTCWRGDRRLFHQVSHVLNSGELVQLEGHNGAGKTSLLRILTGLTQPEDGDVFWDGVSIFKKRDFYNHDMLYLGHKPGLKEVLTTSENLLFYQSTLISPAKCSIASALEKVGLRGYEKVTVNRLSAGQQRRVALARLFMDNDALIWLLDEPFTAIDKQGVEQLMAHFEQHCTEGGIVLFTSHQYVAHKNIPVRCISLNTTSTGV